MKSSSISWPSVIFSIVCCMQPHAAHAENLRLASLFSDHAVLQQGKLVPVWGWAGAGEKIEVVFADQRKNATADESGSWKVALDPLPASATPRELVVTGADGGTRLVIRDVLVGEVWLCSGQSNMEWHVRDALNADQEIAEANFPLIRHFRVPHVISERPEKTVDGDWTVTSPKTVPAFSAVAYFFARDLHRNLKVPVGLINASWGGKMIEVFLSPEQVHDPAFSPVLQRWTREQDRLPAMLAAAAANPGKRMDPRAVVAQHRPSCVFNGMIHPLIPCAIRGAIWYQGEQNISRAKEYRGQLTGMITDWRAKFQQGDFPFYFVQLANFNAPLDKSREGYALLREAQLQTLAVPHTGMAVTMDIGTPDNVHPRNKQDVGARLARIAKARTYDLGGEWSGPALKNVVREKNVLRLSFDHADGLVLKPAPQPAFEIAGADGKFHPAAARLDGATLVVQTDAVSEPAAVRYAWANAPHAVLFNAEGLPASPFRHSLPGS